MELGGKRLVVRDDKGRLFCRRNYVCHGKRLAEAGDAQERLEPDVVRQAVVEFYYSLRLRTGRGKGRDELEFSRSPRSRTGI